MTITATNITATDAREALERVALEYEAKGYQVLREPIEEDLPPFLLPFRPGMIASSPGESVVVAVRNHAGLSDPTLLDFAQAVRDQPGWRLELVVPDEVRSRWDGEPAYPIGADVVDGFVTLADETLHRGQVEAAAVLGWTAVEAALRLLAQENNVVLEDLSPSFLVRQLFSEGWLNRTQYQALMEILEQRNRIVHGLRASSKSETERTEVQQILTVSREILARTTQKGRK